LFDLFIVDHYTFGSLRILFCRPKVVLLIGPSRLG